MKKALRTALALLATAAVLWLLPRAWRRQDQPGRELRVCRVWLLEKEPAVATWIKALAAGYEKETGSRVYLRAATAEEAAAARAGDGAVRPDVLLYPAAAGIAAPSGVQPNPTDGENAAAGRTDAPQAPGSAFDSMTVALRGYALILRDDGAAVFTPAPTSALFFPPPATPGPPPSPAPSPDPASFAAVLAPEELLGAMSGTIRSQNPAGDLAAGKAKAALLTAGQAAKLPFGYRAFALPAGAGLLPVQAQAFSQEGRAFVQSLLREDSQRALRQAGLYSPLLALYGPEDPLRFLIGQSRLSYWAAP